METNNGQRIFYHTNHLITAYVTTMGGDRLRIEAQRDRRSGRFTPTKVVPLGAAIEMPPRVPHFDRLVLATAGR